jgi:dihydrofolate synthase/folylpolyglutamate synthase
VKGGIAVREAERFFAGLPQHSWRLGLDRIEAALDALGRPQGRYPAVLVAGTNGKGSTCSFLHAALCRVHGPGKVGLYTSPHLVSFRERIRIGEDPVAEDALDDAVTRLLAAYPAARDPRDPESLTFFEAATAVAFDLFARAGVAVAVLEVGLGGRLDATNVPGTNLVATAVTRLGLDHVEHLGGSIAAIAGEKAAIARPGAPMISAPATPEARAVLEERTRTVGAPLLEVGRDLVVEEGADGFSYRGPRWRIDGIRVGLLGAHQHENAAVALGVLEAAEGVLGVDPAAARDGLAAARWPGRLEVVSDHPRVILDGAHNPDGARVLAAAFRSTWPDARPEVVFGVLGDKDRRDMLRTLAPLFGRVHVCAPSTPRAVPAEALAAEVRGATGGEAIAHPSVTRAVETALARAGADGTVLVCGSLYLIGEVRRLFRGDRPAV